MLVSSSFNALSISAFLSLRHFRLFLDCKERFRTDRLGGFFGISFSRCFNASLK
jgi:hypothetical protein